MPPPDRAGHAPTLTASANTGHSAEKDHGEGISARAGMERTGPLSNALKRAYSVCPLSTRMRQRLPDSFTVKPNRLP